MHCSVLISLVKDLQWIGWKNGIFFDQKTVISSIMTATTNNKMLMVTTPFGRYNKVFIADMQILGSAFCFGIGFLGQRAVMVHGLGPMTCNAFRFGLSTILLVACLPLIPIDEPELESESEDEADDSHLHDDGHGHGGTNGSPRSLKSGGDNNNEAGTSLMGLKTVSRDVGDAASSSSSSSSAKRQGGIASSGSGGGSGGSKNSFGVGQQGSSSQTHLSGAAKKASVWLKLLGPAGVTKIRSIKRTVWFWGVLLGLINFCGSGTVRVCVWCDGVCCGWVGVCGQGCGCVVV